MMCYIKMYWLCAIIILYSTKLTLGDEPNIVIIGAGPAGIAAASRLYKYNFRRITILEAENRIGGRVNTTWFDQSWIDLGGEWVAGEIDNIVFELAAPLELLEVPQEENLPAIVYNSEGSQIPMSTSNDLFRLFFDIRDKAYCDLKGNNGSLGDYFTQMITSGAEKYTSFNQTLIKQFIDLFEGYQNSLDASDDWYNSSARGYLEYWKCPGNLYVNWKDKGYAAVFDILTEKYPNPEKEIPILNNTKLNSEVVNIDYNSTKGKVLVHLSDGEKYIADYVIVTPSLGVLKERYETLFTPPLPKTKVKTIKGISMGTLAKTFFSFETAWWPNNATGGFRFLWTESDKQEYENDLHRKWLLDLVGFYPVAHRPRILCGLVNGAGARHMETLSEQQAFDQIFAVLQKFLGKSYNITRPIGFLRSNWYSNKHFRGAYSFRSMETEKADVWAEELAAPLQVDDKPIVMFAGEATHSHYYSTVHGAIESGYREAHRLITSEYTRTGYQWS